MTEIEVVGKRGESGRKVQLKVKLTALNVTAYSMVREASFLKPLTLKKNVPLK